MNREIKFRAWDKLNKEMLDWEDIKHWDFYCLCPPINRHEFMQFTGLYDKNKKMIWEGDWFKSKWRTDPYMIIFQDGGFKGIYQWQTKNDVSGFYFDTREAESGEVIGNIYENPELLEDKNE